MRDGMLGPGDLFHIGVIVPDLEAAMVAVSAASPLRWTSVVETRCRHRRPHGVDEFDLRIAYSRGTAPHVELIEAVPGTIFESSGELSRLHHFGLWIDDLAAESARLEGAGMPCVAALLREDGPPDIAFHENSPRELLELCAVSLREGFEAWIAGGTFPV
jgi:hypothetical protein